MKKKTKVTWIVVIAIILMIPVGLGGYIYIRNVKMHNEMVEAVKENQDLLLDYLQADTLDSRRKVKYITIEYDKLRHDPMGGVITVGFVNGNKSLGFELGIDKYTIDGRERIECTGGVLDEALSDFLENS